MKPMDVQELNGRSILVSLATERPSRQGGFGGGGGGGGGGYNLNFNDAGNDRFIRSIMNSISMYRVMSHFVYTSSLE
ncbi:hypothetical protein Tco_1090366 [Tanacetum coccineum]|uniref:Uncharacterized protein n=1 Tax=Tanacetum coccineum TaxID=301880 RepID=A0ABQ5I400_9ASTR